MTVGSLHKPHGSTSLVHAGNNTPPSYYDHYEIRSGMSVQDLKHLTAQREYRQRMEYYYESSAAARCRSSFSSTSSSSSSSSSCGSANNSPAKNGTTYYSPAYSTGSYSPPQTSAGHGYSHHSHHPHSGVRKQRSGSYPSPSCLHSPCRDTNFFVTCGGQVVSFVEGVVNAPQVDFSNEYLATI